MSSTLTSFMAAAYMLFVGMNISSTQAVDVFLSAGIGGYSHDQLWQQYASVYSYSRMPLLTGTSILAYYLQENGTLGVYNTSDPVWPDGETYQQYLATETKTKAVPCLYCDATIGNCANLSQRLDNLYPQAEQFIQTTLQLAATFGWSGYTVDFEPDSSVNSTALTAFIEQWAAALTLNTLRLYVWIGGDTQYDMDILQQNRNITLVSMDTYADTFDDFVQAANPLLTSSVTGVGYGLLTDYGSNRPNNHPNHRKIGLQMMNGSDMMQVAQWTTLTRSDSLHLWASHISPDWYPALNMVVATL